MTVLELTPAMARQAAASDWIERDRQQRMADRHMVRVRAGKKVWEGRR